MREADLPRRARRYKQFSPRRTRHDGQLLMLRRCWWSAAGYATSTPSPKGNLAHSERGRAYLCRFTCNADVVVLNAVRVTCGSLKPTRMVSHRRGVRISFPSSAILFPPSILQQSGSLIVSFECSRLVHEVFVRSKSSVCVAGLPAASHRR